MKNFNFLKNGSIDFHNISKIYSNLHSIPNNMALSGFTEKFLEVEKYCFSFLSFV